MDTNKITKLCRKSERIFNDRECAEGILNKIDDVISITIRIPHNIFTVGIDDYPELKPLAEKIIKCMIESGQVKQEEIKTEIAKCL